MNGIIVSPFVFRQMEDKLIQLSGSLEHISLMVCRIDDPIRTDASIPESVKALVEENLEKQMTGIACICQSLASLASDMSGDAGDWGWWAEKNNIDIDYKG